MTKKCIAALLILVFLNLVVMPDFIFAKSPVEELEDETIDRRFEAALIGTAILVGVVLVIYLATKSKSSNQSSSLPDEPKERNQENKVLSTTDDAPVTPLGQVVVLKW